jgi:hypothetical protein
MALTPIKLEDYAPGIKRPPGTSVVPSGAVSIAPALAPVRPVAPVTPIAAPIRASAPVMAPMNNRTSEPIVMQGYAKPMEKQSPAGYIRSFLQPLASKITNAFTPRPAEASVPVSLAQKQEDEAKRKSNSPTAVLGIRG